MVISRIPTFTQAQLNRQLLQTNAQRYNELSRQITTNRKVAEIIDHGSRLDHVQDLRNRFNHRERLLTGISTIENVVSVYESTLAAFKTELRALRNYADLSSVDREQWESLARPGAENFLRHFQGLLNTRLLNKYIFSGTRFETEPVAITDAAGNRLELHQLPNFRIDHAPGADNLAFTATNQAGAALYQVNAPQLPIYDSQFDPTDPQAQHPDSYRDLTFVIEYGNPLDYTISSNHEVFQEALHAARLLFSATEPPNVNDDLARRELTNEAYRSAQNALEGLERLEEQNDLRKYILDVARKDHEFHQQKLERSYATEVTVESTAVATAELNNLDTLIRASYNIIRQRNELSLVNFLR